MKLILFTYKTHRFFFLIMLLFLSCNKEKTITPSGLDKDIYANHDNADDPIDHAMYLFYKETGVANYYSDTIAVQKISKDGKFPERDRYIKLSLSRSNADYLEYISTPISNKLILPGILELIKKDVFPKLPAENYISCLLFLDDILNSYRYLKVDISHGMCAVIGFNTVGIVSKNTNTMSEDERKMYASSILAGLTINKIISAEHEYLKSNFFAISRQLSKPVLSTDVYISYPVLSVLDPTNFALLYFPIVNNYFFESFYLPTEDSDLRSFLTMVFRYNEESFIEIYENFPFIIQKYKVLKELLARKGYHLPA